MVTSYPIFEIKERVTNVDMSQLQAKPTIVPFASNLRSKSNRNEPMQQALSRHRQLNPIKRFKYGGESVN